MPRLERVMVWRNAEQDSLEYCNLFSDEGNWTLDGTVVMVLAGRPTRIRFDIRCAANWQTQQVNVELHVGSDKQSLQITVDDATELVHAVRTGKSLDSAASRDVLPRVGPERRWRLDGSEQEDLRGCFDVDLAITPATNTLPIRRVNPRVGESFEIVAAMVRFPDLLLEPVRQKYTRLETNRYLFESVGTGYTAELEVNELGLVTNYSGGWERVAEA